jgi:hypothetical protein
MREDARPAHAQHCPTCQKVLEGSRDGQRPFCSLTCRLVDLGRWLDGRYHIPADRDERADVP